MKLELSVPSGNETLTGHELETAIDESLEQAVRGELAAFFAGRSVVERRDLVTYLSRGQGLVGQTAQVIDWLVEDGLLFEHADQQYSLEPGMVEVSQPPVEPVTVEIVLDDTPDGTTVTEVIVPLHEPPQSVHEPPAVARAVAALETPSAIRVISAPVAHERPLPISALSELTPETPPPHFDPPFAQSTFETVRVILERLNWHAAREEGLLLPQLLRDVTDDVEEVRAARMLVARLWLRGLVQRYHRTDEEDSRIALPPDFPTGGGQWQTKVRGLLDVLTHPHDPHVQQEKTGSVSRSSLHLNGLD